MGHHRLQDVPHDVERVAGGRVQLHRSDTPFMAAPLCLAPAPRHPSAPCDLCQLARSPPLRWLPGPARQPVGKGFRLMGVPALALHALLRRARGPPTCGPVRVASLLGGRLRLNAVYARSFA